jgi:short-subunit dehydrogenase
MPKAIIIGASTGIGRDLAIELSNRGYELALTARRVELLEELGKELKNKYIIRRMDVEQHEEARNITADLIKEMGSVDVLVYNAGIGNKSGNWNTENQMLQVNAIGFAAISNFIFQHWKQNKQKGHLVGVSSMASLRGSRMAIGYCATKAFMSSYMDGLRNESVAKKLGITITEIRPGYVATPMTDKQKGMFWLATSAKAAKQMADAIESKTDMAYITKRWRLAAAVMRNIPAFIWNRQ